MVDPSSPSRRVRRRSSTKKEDRVRMAPATVPERETREIASEPLRPQNQGLELVGSATNFNEYVENTYKPLLMPLMAKTTRGSTLPRRDHQSPGAGVRKAFSSRSDASHVTAVFLWARSITFSA